MATNPLTLRARVLVIDDEPAIGKVVQRILRGCDVVWVDGGAGALVALERAEPFDAILCDLMMPGMSGVEVYEALRARRPSLLRRMAIMTGGATTPAADAFFAHVPIARLMKPFDIEGLRALIANLAGRTPTAAPAI